MKKAVECNVADFMSGFLHIRARVNAPKVLKCLKMLKNNEKAYYAVGRGRELGIYNTWSECKSQIDGITNAKFRKFYSLEEAEEFVNFWKDYESPSKASSQSQIVVSSVPSNDGKSDSERGSDNKGLIRKRPNVIRPLLPEKISEQQGSDLNSEKCFKVYVSPLTSQIRSKFLMKKCDSLLREPEQRTLLDDSSGRRGNGSFSVFDQYSVDSIVMPKTSFKFVTSANFVSSSSQNNSVDFFNVCQNSTSCVTPTQNIFTKCDRPSENMCSERQSLSVERTVKEEIVEIDNRIPMHEETSQDEQLNSFLESAMSIISKLENPERLRSCLKLLIEKIITSTNSPINLQIESEESVTRNCDDGAQASTEPPPPTTPPPPSMLLSPPSPRSTPLDQRSVDVMALNLRLDSFEKRFDSCLKEVGALASEISNIKSDIKEIKESLGFASCSQSRPSPSKSGGGMTQTTLRFSSSAANSDDCASRSPSCSYFSKKHYSDSGEPVLKKSRTLKRKLSKGNSPKNSDNDEDEDNSIWSRIKTEAVDYTSFNVDSNEFVEVYTDGACQMNGKSGAKAGIGIWFGDSHPLNVSAPVSGPATNNSAEIQAARVAVELALKTGISKLKILTDSEFLINCATKWMRRWKKNGWTLVDGGPVKNRKELEKLDKVMSKITVQWEKVEAHSGVKGNEMADRLAVEGASKYKR